MRARLRRCLECALSVVPVPDAIPLKTPLHALHVSLGARMVPFAGYDMPVQFPMGILAEHQWVRAHAGLFDVSHMGQVSLKGAGAAIALERLVPGDIQALKAGRMRYTMFTNERAGILDDLMVTRRENGLFLVVNAACKQSDLAHLGAHLWRDCAIVEHHDRALLALQGPEAAPVLAELAPAAAELGFMTGAEITISGLACFVTRSGYTGEDGFEISVAASGAEALAHALLQHPSVKPIGLGARDSLRLEAGLCLYGHDIDETTTPIEADLVWTISPRRRSEGGYPGDAIVKQQLASGVARKRVGIAPQEKAPAREHTKVLDREGAEIGEITSGGFGPSLGAPVAMGYVAAAAAAPATPLQLVIRDHKRPALVASLPFVPHRYHRRG
jgi:aminomethyltransferase